MQQERIAILGGGNLGRALALGWAKAGMAAADITVTRRQTDRIADLGDRGFEITADNPAAVAAARTLIVAVQPQQVPALIDEIRSAIDPARHVVISVVSGVTIASLIAVNSGHGRVSIRRRCCWRDSCSMTTFNAVTRPNAGPS